MFFFKTKYNYRSSVSIKFNILPADSVDTPPSGPSHVFCGRGPGYHNKNTPLMLHASQYLFYPNFCGFFVEKVNKKCRAPR